MNLYNINVLISPLCLGVGTCLQNLFLALFTTNLLHFELYTGTNLICLAIVAGTCVIGQFTMISANKYSAASKMAPISYSENVVTLLADALIFGYKFVLTDIVGILVIVVCIAIPVIQKLKA